MKKIRNFIIGLTFLMGLIIISSCRNQTFVLGQNLIINPDFQSPDIDPYNNLYTYFPNQIKGWSCTSNCEIISIPFICYHRDSRYCPNIKNRQMIDTSSDGPENITQTINLPTNATYNIAFKWLPPIYNPLSKSISLWINQTMITKITIQPSNERVQYFNLVSMNIYLPAGALILNFQMNGSDNSGIFIDDVFLAEYIEVSSNYEMWVSSLEYCFGNKFVQIFNRYPGSRIFFKFVMNFYINFDRLQFYIFHNQKFTQYSLILIEKIHLLLQQKGSLLQIIIKQQRNSSSLMQKIYQQGKILQKTIDFKQEYSSIYILSKSDNGGQFIENEFDFFYYEVPYSIITFLLCLSLFKLLSQYRFSLSLRKYCFKGIIFFIFFEGNVEEFTFYTILELKLFFSHNVLHKGANTLLSVFWFAVILFSFAVLPFCFFCYGRKIKYLMEDCRPIAFSLIAATIDSGLVPLASGLIHSLFLEQLWPITVLLIVMELFWAMARVWFLQRRLYVHNARICIQITTGMLRISLLVTLYLYEQNGSSLMNDIHFLVVLCYILLWVAQTILSLILFIKLIVFFFKPSISKVVPKPRLNAFKLEQKSKQIHSKINKINLNNVLNVHQMTTVDNYNTSKIEKYLLTPKIIRKKKLVLTNKTQKLNKIHE